MVASSGGAPGYLRGRHAGRVHAHVGELAGIHAIAFVPHLPHQVRCVSARAPPPAGEPPHPSRPDNSRPWCGALLAGDLAPLLAERVVPVLTGHE